MWKEKELLLCTTYLEADFQSNSLCLHSPLLLTLVLQSCAGSLAELGLAALVVAFDFVARSLGEVYLAALVVALGFVAETFAKLVLAMLVVALAFVV